MRLAARAARSAQRAWLKLAVIFLSIAFCTAPVPGDVGGCGRKAEPLLAESFFQAKAALDCARCEECGLNSRACVQSCSTRPATQDFPVACVPVVHDGDACLRALAAADCDAYRTFVRDQAPSVPNECNFCPKEAP